MAWALTCGPQILRECGWMIERHRPRFVELAVEVVVIFVAGESAGEFFAEIPE